MPPTQPFRFALVLLATAVPAFCGDWNPRLAAQYLDSRQKEWFAWKPAAAPGGTCFSCHTGMTYLLARPGLRRILGEGEATLYETNLLDGLRARVDKREGKAVFPAFGKEPLGSQALGVESIFAALFLAPGNQASAEQAFDRMWSLQLREGKAKGSWAWFQLALDPWEMPDSPFYGAALAALAATTAPAEYRERPEIRAHLADLAAYLRNELPSQPLHNRAMLLWTAAGVPDLLPKSGRKRLVKELLAKQQPDGGWTIASLGPWKDHPQAPDSPGSNAYATGLASFLLLKAGVAPSVPGVGRALEWLRTHQDPRLGYWEAKSMNKHFEPGSMQDQFMRDAATSFAAMALVEADGGARKPQDR
jgi:squalene-hopene/tetraprenyl-beta-curcumene cyclase